jgi:hypothetical protein
MMSNPRDAAIVAHVLLLLAIEVLSPGSVRAG